MKKIISALLVLSLALSLSSAALADSATLNRESPTKTVDVSAVYVAGARAAIEYSVNITWGAMEFSYSVTGENVWDEATNSFVASETAEWSATGNEITVTNHSNDIIEVNYLYEAHNDYDDVSGSFSDNNVFLESAEGKELDAESIISKSTLTLSGVLTSEVDTSTSIGTVTVQLSEPQGL